DGAGPGRAGRGDGAGQAGGGAVLRAGAVREVTSAKALPCCGTGFRSCPKGGQDSDPVPQQGAGPDTPEAERSSSAAGAACWSARLCKTGMAAPVGCSAGFGSNVMDICFRGCIRSLHRVIGKIGSTPGAPSVGGLIVGCLEDKRSSSMVYITPVWHPC